MADGLRYAAFGAALSFGLASAAAVPCDGLSQGKPEKIPIRPGVDVEIEVPATSKGMLIEEFGGDLQVRAAPDAEFVDIVIRPSRLGIAAIRARSTTVTVRLNPAHAAASIVVRSRCANESDLRFFEALSRRYSEQIEAGAKRATEAIPQIEQELTVTADRVQRAWLSGALANAIMSAGRHNQSIAAFMRARAEWQAINEPVRAAVALMAMGEDESRTGRYDDADNTLDAARIELKAAGLTYYELRARGQQCLIMSRRGFPEDAANCETAVANQYESIGEIAEAGARGISIANQWMKVGKLDKARDRMLRVEERDAMLSPLMRAKLNATFGTYYLETGALDSAVRELLAASDQLGQLGLPREQANIDIKLARAAQQAGAYDEELRLLESALKRIDAIDAPETVASANIRIATLYLARAGSASMATASLDRADAICRQLAKRDCLARIQYHRVLECIAQGDTKHAREELTELIELQATGNQVATRLASAKLHLLENDPVHAIQELDEIGNDIGDPDLELESVLVRAAGLVAIDRPAAAKDWILAALESLVARSIKSPSIALRASAQYRISDLQSRFFDFIEPDTAGAISGAALAHIRVAIDHANSSRIYQRTASSQHFSDTLRLQMSAAAGGEDAVDQRALLEAFNLPAQVDAGTQRSSPPQSSDLAEPHRQEPGGALLQLFPLVGHQHFRLIAMANGVARQCLAMSREEYDRLAAAFEEALDGQAIDLNSLNTEAERWFNAISVCHPIAASGWVVVAIPGTPTVPWAWIVAMAPSGAANEPWLAMQFDSTLRASPQLRAPSSASVLNLNLTSGNALPLATIEASKTERIFNVNSIPVKIMHGGSLSPSSLLAEMSPPARWIHVIGHGNSSDYGSIYSGLWLPAAGRPLLVAFPEIASARLEANLVLLSACGDARSDRKFVGSRLRIAEALRVAGVETVVVSSNAASDSAAAYWTPKFFESALSTQNAAVAAMAAREALRATPHFRHPKFWAGIEVYQ